MILGFWNTKYPLTRIWGIASYTWDILGLSQDSHDIKYSGMDASYVVIRRTSQDDPGIPRILSIQGSGVYLDVRHPGMIAGFLRY